MKTYIIHALVPVTFTVDAESEQEARDKAVTLKRYSMISPDGERVEVNPGDIVGVQLAEE